MDLRGDFKRGEESFERTDSPDPKEQSNAYTGHFFDERKTNQIFKPIQRRRNLLLLQEKKLIVREGDRRDEISAIASTDTEDYAAIRGGPIIGEKIAFGEQRYHSDTSSRGGGSIQKDNVGEMEYPLNLFPHIVTRLVRNGFHCRSSIELRLLHSRLAEG